MPKFKGGRIMRSIRCLSILIRIFAFILLVMSISCIDQLDKERGLGVDSGSETDLSGVEGSIPLEVQGHEDEVAPEDYHFFTDDFGDSELEGPLNLAGTLTFSLFSSWSFSNFSLLNFDDEEKKMSPQCWIMTIDVETAEEKILKKAFADDDVCHFENLPPTTSLIIRYIANAKEHRDAIVPYTEDGEKVIADPPDELRHFQANVFVNTTKKLIEEYKEAKTEIPVAVLKDGLPMILDLVDEEILETDDPTTFEQQMEALTNAFVAAKKEEINQITSKSTSADTLNVLAKINRENSKLLYQEIRKIREEEEAKSIDTDDVQGDDVVDHATAIEGEEFVMERVCKMADLKARIQITRENKFVEESLVGENELDDLLERMETKKKVAFVQTFETEKEESEIIDNIYDQGDDFNRVFQSRSFEVYEEFEKLHRMKNNIEKIEDPATDVVMESIDFIEATRQQMLNIGSRESLEKIKKQQVVDKVVVKTSQEIIRHYTAGMDFRAVTDSYQEMYSDPDKAIADKSIARDLVAEQFAASIGGGGGSGSGSGRMVKGILNDLMIMEDRFEGYKHKFKKEDDFHVEEPITINELFDQTTHSSMDELTDFVALAVKEEVMICPPPAIMRCPYGVDYDEDRDGCLIQTCKDIKAITCPPTIDPKTCKYGHKEEKFMGCVEVFCQPPPIGDSCPVVSRIPCPPDFIFEGMVLNATDNCFYPQCKPQEIIYDHTDHWGYENIIPETDDGTATKTDDTTNKADGSDATSTTTDPDYPTHDDGTTTDPDYPPPDDGTDPNYPSGGDGSSGGSGADLCERPPDFCFEPGAYFYMQDPYKNCVHAHCKQPELSPCSENKHCLSGYCGKDRSMPDMGYMVCLPYY